MTISYSGSFLKLLLRWKGSIWKAVWMELVVFLCFYHSISLIYRLGLNNDEQERFDKLANLFNAFSERVPLNFLLGFYVTSVVRRWWEQFQYVAWPDDVLSYVCVLMPTKEQLGARRTVARWLNLTAALAWRDISKSVRRRFPTLSHLLQSGLMTKEELKIYDGTQTPTIRWSLPLFWVHKVVDSELSIEQRKAMGPIYAQFMREMNIYRNCFKTLYCYDWVCIPLVYTQVAALATYGYFIICLIGRQFLKPSRGYPGSAVDMYIPVFTILEFTFYVGWFKLKKGFRSFFFVCFYSVSKTMAKAVGEILQRQLNIRKTDKVVIVTEGFQVGQYLMRPFEEEDDDIELNYMIDRHIQTAFSIVDEVMAMAPPALEDGFSKMAVPTIPYTRMSLKRQQHPPKLHAHVQSRSAEDEEVVDPSAVVDSGRSRKLSRHSSQRIRQF